MGQQRKAFYAVAVALLLNTVAAGSHRHAQVTDAGV